MRESSWYLLAIFPGVGSVHELNSTCLFYKKNMKYSHWKSITMPIQIWGKILVILSKIIISQNDHFFQIDLDEKSAHLKNMSKN